MSGGAGGEARADDAAAKPRWPVRAGLAITTFIYCLYSSFGIAAPFWWGHHGYHGATYMLRARMSLRLHMLSPATWGGFETPPQAALYFHHPIGYHHILTLLIPIFGDHEWLARGVAAAGGLLVIWALYTLVARSWSREAGLVAVIVYVALPVVTSFSVLSDPMLPAMACVLWSLSAYLSLLEKPSTRALRHAFAAYALGGFIMWEAYFIAPFIAVHALFYSRTRRGRTLTLGRWNALVLHTLVTGAACCLMMAFHIWFTHHAGAWQDFLDSYRIRHAPPSSQYVIDRHVQWIDTLYGKTPVIFGALWFVTWLGRVATGRTRRRDIAVLTFLYVNTIYIYMFAEGSSVHLYRVFFYSSFFALAVTDLVWDCYWAAHRLWTHAPAWAPAVVAGALLAGYLVAEVPKAFDDLLQSRVVMGTFGEAAYSPQAEKMRFAAEVHARTSQSERVIIHYPHLGARKEFWYYIDRNYDEITALTQLDRLKKTQPRSVLILDERMLNGGDRQIYEELIRKHPVTFFDNFVMIDLRSDKPGAQSFAFAPLRMSLAYRWFVSHKYPPLALVRRAYLPGECSALALGVPVARDEELPEPHEARLVPCYHDLLVERGDLAAARNVEKEASDGLTPIAANLGDTRVIAVGARAGKLVVVLVAGSPSASTVRYVLAAPGRAPLASGSSPSLPAPRRWQSGRLYIDEVGIPRGRFDVEMQLVDTRPAPPPRPPFAPQPAETVVVTRAALGSIAN
jgi:4-amino-4-deoxy-L-arabinose transferase-like glycosyltransferase